MRRPLLILIGVVALVVTILELPGWLASETTLVRWRIEEMVEGFNDARVSPCVEGVAEEWRDDRDGRIDRTLLADVLRSVFFHEKDLETRRFRYRIELEGEPGIDLDPADERRAAVDVTARFDCLVRGEWTATWRVRILAAMKKHPDEGWQVHRTRRETLWSDGRLMRASRR